MGEDNALVTGSTGSIARQIVAYLQRLPNREVIGLSQRALNDVHAQTSLKQHRVPIRPD
jgi:dTDP-4-dehydrorhamnose reductase